MKISDFIFRHRHTNNFNKDGIFRIRIFINNNSKIFSLITDIGSKNPGQSVTNCIEYIRLSLIEEGHINHIAALIEHYEESTARSATFDLVAFIDTNGNPKWESIGAEDLCGVLECDLGELNDSTLKNKRLFNRIENIRHQIDPHLGEPWAESVEVIKKRLDLADKKLSLGSLKELIHNRAGETEIAKFINADLSLFGDFYNEIQEEYICFSEFPVDDGFVDYVVFSGRSRMEVTLIEIKGADFNFITNNSYEDFSARANQAAQQIRKRLGYIYRNYEEFRKYCHVMRQRAEAGELRSSYLAGPRGRLEVSSEKDINIHCIIIGGRGVNDWEESRLRHDFERASSPGIRIETWDSWLNKHPRKESTPTG